MVAVTTQEGPLLIVPFEQGDVAQEGSRGHMVCQDGSEVECALYSIQEHELAELHPSPVNLRGRFSVVRAFVSPPTLDSINAFLEMGLMPSETNVDGEVWLTASEAEVAAAAREPMERQMSQVQTTLNQLAKTMDA